MKPLQDIVPGQPVIIYSKDQPQYIPLPCVRLAGPNGTIVTRWGMTWRERWQLVFGGSIWLTVMTFGLPLQPVKLNTECPVKTLETIDHGNPEVSE